MDTLKQGTRVEFGYQIIKGKGTIVGLATDGQPIIGKFYIIEPDDPINNKAYNYTHFCLYECYFKVI